jgi:hypothetical protein
LYILSYFNGSIYRIVPTNNNMHWYLLQLLNW